MEAMLELTLHVTLEMLLSDLTYTDRDAVPTVSFFMTKQAVCIVCTAVLLQSLLCRLWHQ